MQGDVPSMQDEEFDLSSELGGKDDEADEEGMGGLETLESSPVEEDE